MNAPFQNLELELKISGLDDCEIRVEALDAIEQLNDLYELSLMVLVDHDVAIEERALRREAWLAIRRGDRRRVFHGILREVEVRGFRSIVHRRMLECRLSLVPRAWLMSQRRTSRIFQNMTIDAVVRAVLAGYFIHSRWMLERRYPVRPYCTQYEETDLAFVKRLTAEAGILFYFEQPCDEQPAFMLPGGMGGAIAGGAGEALAGVAATAIPDAVGWLPGLVGGPREIIVFADSELAYVPLGEGKGSSWQELASQLAGSIGSVAGAAVGQVGGAALGGAVQETVHQATGMVAAALGATGPIPVLRVRSDSGALAPGDDHAVFDFRRRHAVRAERFVFREYDPSRPHAPLSSTIAASTIEAADDLLHGARGALEGLLRGAGAPVAGFGAMAGEAMEQLDHWLPNGHELEQYEHHSHFLFPEWSYEQDEPRRMARAARRRIDIASATSICPWLEPGRVFCIDDHELARLNRDYAIVRVHHRLETDVEDRPWTYRNELECVPANIPYVPERPSRREVHVCLTATVMAGDDTQIHTDPGAHVRVRFHWDRGQHAQAFNTCWIRVMQPWAGPGFGTLFLPRQGSEVVVTFEGGDPDRPLILGSVYNGANLPPTALPVHKTKSGIVTSSTPGGEGSNELWFEDAAGQEQVYLHAQRDFDQEVGRDRTVVVGQDERASIERDQRIQVRGDQHLEIGRSRETRLGDSDTLRVDGNRMVTVRGSDHTAIQGDADARITGSSRFEVHGAHTVVIRGDAVARHRGNVTRIVGAPDAPRSCVTHVEGRYEASSTRTLELRADESIVLRCGDTMLRLTPDGIDLLSKSIGLQGEGARLRIVDKSVFLQADELIRGVAKQILWKSTGAALALSSEAAVEGSRILLNSPQSAQDSVADDPVQTTTIELVDDEGQPIPNQPYRIVLSDGSERSGVLDENGRAEIILDGDGDIFFPGVRDVTQE